MPPTDNPYNTADTPAEWGQVVGDFVEQRAEQSEKFDDRQGEYKTTLNDAAIAKEFKAHAQQYSRALWRWAQEQVPPHIKDWVFTENSDPHSTPHERLGYLLIRRETFDWWDVRSRTEQTPENLRTTATQFMCLPNFLLLASGIRDVELFEHLAKPRTQGRPNKRPADLAFYLRSYWMAWSMWQDEHSGRIKLLNRRLNFDIGKSAMSETITRLELRP